MKIGLATYKYYPTISPRAFRTHELAKEFIRQGHDVTVFCVESETNNCKHQSNEGITVIPVKSGVLLNKNIEAVSEPNMHSSKQSLLKIILRKLLHSIYMGGISFEFAFTLFKELKRYKNFDIFISVGLPISVHIATGLRLRKKPAFTKLSIADYGDPYSANKSQHANLLQKRVEALSLKKFDYISTPINQSVSHYLKFKDKEKIIIIPQGLKIEDYEIEKYSKNPIPTFAYAGVFIKKIRDPSFFFEYLISLDIEYKFFLYTNLKHPDTRYFLDKYQPYLKSKLKIIDLVPRKDCIRELSKMDFLLNFKNNSSLQSPSKLIDYAISKRPVFELNENKFDEEKFKKFLDYNFEGSETIDLAPYKIEYICKKITSLLKNAS